MEASSHRCSQQASAKVKRHAAHRAVSMRVKPLMSNWIEVGKLEDIPRLGTRVVRIADEAVGIFRTADDRVFALRDRCPHRGGPLSQGIVFDTHVACPLHDWVIDLQTGRAVGPDEGCVATYPVRIDQGRVLLLPRAGAVTAGATTQEPMEA